MGITHVIDLRKYHSRKLHKFHVLWLGCQNDAWPRRFYSQALFFYLEAMDQPNSKVYVMCDAGRKRSANLTHFLLRASGVGASKAEATIRKARPCAQLVPADLASGEEYLRRRKRWLNL